MNPRCGSRQVLRDVPFAFSELLGFSRQSLAWEQRYQRKERLESIFSSCRVLLTVGFWRFGQWCVNPPLLPPPPPADPSPSKQENDSLF